MSCPTERSDSCPFERLSPCDVTALGGGPCGSTIVAVATGDGGGTEAAVS